MPLSFRPYKICANSLLLSQSMFLALVNTVLQALHGNTNLILFAVTHSDANRHSNQDYFAVT